MYESRNVAERINSLINKSNLIQKDLLEHCGLNKNAISSMQYRNSMPKADNLAKIADYLDCSVDFLLGRTNNPTGYYQSFQAGNINLGDVNSSHVNVGNEVISSAASQLNDEILIEIQKILDNLTLQQKGKFIDYIYKFEK